MALEDLTGTKYLDSLVSSNPTSGDDRVEGDDHIRGIKNTLKLSFPNVSGAVTPTHTELNYCDLTTLGQANNSQFVSVDGSGVVDMNDKEMTNVQLTAPEINDTSKDHQYVVAVSELAADRTVTLPLLTGNDEFTFNDHTQTLTNKTLTSPVINVTSDAEGDIYYRNSGGAFTRLAAGTAGQVLQTNGVAAPSWAGGASASYLGEITGGTTGQELGELTGIATTTKVITLLFSGVSVDTNAKGIQIEIGDSSGYAAVSEGTAGVIVGGIYYSNGYTGGKAYVRGPQGGLATSTFYGTITLTKRDSANVWMVSGNVGSGTVSSIAWTGGYIDNAAGVVDRIKITCESAANFDGGSVQVFERT